MPLKIAITITEPDRTIMFEGEGISEDFAISVLREMMAPPVSIAELKTVSSHAVEGAASSAQVAQQLTELAKDPA